MDATGVPRRSAPWSREILGGAPELQLANRFSRGWRPAQRPVPPLLGALRQRYWRESPRQWLGGQIRETHDSLFVRRRVPEPVERDVQIHELLPAPGCRVPR